VWRWSRIGKRFRRPNNIIKHGLLLSGMYEMKPVRPVGAQLLREVRRRDGRIHEHHPSPRSAAHADHR
jgi:hypothetical protein